MTCKYSNKSNLYSRLTFKSIIISPETLDLLVVSNALHVYLPASRCVTFRTKSPPSWTEYFPPVNNEDIFKMYKLKIKNLKLLYKL